MTPNGAVSARSTRLKPSIANFAAWYEAMLGEPPTRPPMEENWTMEHGLVDNDELVRSQRRVAPLLQVLTSPTVTSPGLTTPTAPSIVPCVVLRETVFPGVPSLWAAYRRTRSVA
ncbi:hypothetical protein GCM10010331_16250 [Streptomyces xanthochromogenes]|nr:hypothetical protein GCM10010331_16250 [Streptomyces xanthochromogenes]